MCTSYEKKKKNRFVLLNLKYFPLLYSLEKYFSSQIIKISVSSSENYISTNVITILKNNIYKLHLPLQVLILAIKHLHEY